MTIVTSPADNVKTRIMNERAGVEKKYNGIFDCIGKMWNKEGGVAAFYRGFGPQWARFAPFITIQLLAWEWLRKLSGIQGL
jgi:hypothetical protein